MCLRCSALVPHCYRWDFGPSFCLLKKSRPGLCLRSGLFSPYSLCHLKRLLNLPGAQASKYDLDSICLQKFLASLALPMGGLSGEALKGNRTCLSPVAALPCLYMSVLGLGISNLALLLNDLNACAFRTSYRQFVPANIHMLGCACMQPPRMSSCPCAGGQHA